MGRGSPDAGARGEGLPVAGPGAAEPPPGRGTGRGGAHGAERLAGVGARGQGGRASRARRASRGGSRAWPREEEREGREREKGTGGEKLTFGDPNSGDHVSKP
jgi:hypothetical protein